jgi:hypothetical protein
MGRFLIWLSGANRQILDSTANDRAKYVGMGTLILLPGVMGAVSMTFALTTALNLRLAVALPFAVAWGLAIICMDRVFVVTLQRKRNWLAIPRILLALLLGFVISTPFVLQIFRPEIEQQIIKLQNQAANQFIGTNASNKVAGQIAKDKATISQLQTAIKAGATPDLAGDPTLKGLNAQLQKDQSSESTWYNQWQCQLYGTSQGGGKCRAGNGTLAQHSETEYNHYVAQVASEQQAITAREKALTDSAEAHQTATAAQDQKQLATAQQQLLTDQNLQAAQTATFISKNKQDTGLLIRLKALDIVTAGNTTLEETRWLLFALFVAIDLMPVLIKVMMNWAAPSNYEKLLADEETTNYEVAENKRAAWKQAQFRAAQTIVASSRDRLAGLNAPLPEVKDSVIAARRRVEGEWLRTWEEDQMRRIANGGEITTGHAGVAAEQPASSAPLPPPQGRYQPQPRGQYEGRPSRSWLRDFRESFSWWREPAEPGPEAVAGRTRADASPRGPARGRARPGRGDAWPDELFRRRIPGDAPAEDAAAPRMFLREFVPPSAPPGSGPAPGDPDESTRGTYYR